MDSTLVGTYTSTVCVSATDTASALPSASITYSYVDNNSGTPVTRYKYYRALLISVEGNDVRVNWGANPTQTPPLGNVFVKGENFRVVGASNVENMIIINATAGNTSTLQITAER